MTDIVWRTSDGFSLTMDQMDSTHIQNVVRMITKQRDADDFNGMMTVCESGGGGSSFSLGALEDHIEQLNAKIDQFKAELEKRGITE